MLVGLTPGVYTRVGTLIPSYVVKYCAPFIFSDTVKLGYNELGCNEHSVITNIFLSQIGHFSAQINPVITNPGFNEQNCPAPSCSL